MIIIISYTYYLLATSNEKVAIGPNFQNRYTVITESKNRTFKVNMSHPLSRMKKISPPILITCVVGIFFFPGFGIRTRTYSFFSQ
jgi:hypothetical protein